MRFKEWLMEEWNSNCILKIVIEDKEFLAKVAGFIRKLGVRYSYIPEVNTSLIGANNRPTFIIDDVADKVEYALGKIEAKFGQYNHFGIEIERTEGC